MKITHYASGSKANAFLVETDKKILIDTGLKGIPADIVLLTHVHGDHFMHFEKYLPVIEKWYSTKEVYDEVIDKLSKKASGNNLMAQALEKFAGKDEMKKFGITVLPLFHDVSCAGFIVEQGEESYCHLTDTVRVPILEAFKNHTYYSIESNYDELMVHQTKRPQMVIERIIEQGHMSNDIAGRTARKLIGERTKLIAWIHLSGETNNKSLAEVTHKEYIPEHVTMLYPVGEVVYETS